MRKREIIVPWHEQEEGDRFLRYVWEGAVKRLVVEREAEDLPVNKGAMGYGTVQRSGVTHHDVLLIRVRPAGMIGTPWVAPFLLGNDHSLQDDHIVAFKEMRLVENVLPGDIRDAIRDAIHEAGTESLGPLVSAIERRVWTALDQT